METTKYAFKSTMQIPYEEAIQKVMDELRNEGFGVLTEIDVKETMKKKLDVDFRKYKILGACNPPNAFKALQAETDIGLMLPCNVVVYEVEQGKTIVAAVDPVASMMAIDNPALAQISREIQTKLQRVIRALE
jgi:uncharacterized protein (DUF302 family)